jgi:hypothetical protein
MGPIRFIQPALSHPLPAISFSPLSISVAIFAVFRFRRVNYNRLAVNYSYRGVNYRGMGALSATPARRAANVAKGHMCARPEYISYTTGGRGTSTHPHAGTVISNPFQPTSMTYSHRTIHSNALIYMVLVLGSISVR